MDANIDLKREIWCNIYSTRIRFNKLNLELTFGIFLSINR